MPLIEGIPFDEKSYELVQELIKGVRLLGDCYVYGLSRMHALRGEVRIAHLGPDPKHPKTRRVFALIMPTKAGAVIRRPGPLADGQPKVVLTNANLEQLLRNVASWRSQRSKSKS